MQPLAIVLDFDGTATMEDVGDLVVRKFCVPGWEEGFERFKRGEIGVREVWGHEIGHLRAGRDAEMAEFVREAGRIRLGLHELVGFARSAGIPIEIASNGMAFYLEAILEKAGLSDLACCSPAVTWDEAGCGTMSFADGVIHCAMTGLCKCERVWSHRREGRRVVFIGDGVSDLCVARQADILFACRSLARYCDENGIPYIPFNDFFDVLAEVKRLVTPSSSPLPAGEGKGEEEA